MDASHGRSRCGRGLPASSRADVPADPPALGEAQAGSIRIASPHAKCRPGQCPEPVRIVTAERQSNPCRPGSTSRQPALAPAYCGAASAAHKAAGVSFRRPFRGPSRPANRFCPRGIPRFLRQFTGFSLSPVAFLSALLGIESGQRRSQHHVRAARPSRGRGCRPPRAAMRERATRWPARQQADGAGDTDLRTAPHAVQQRANSDDTRTEHRWPRPKKAQSD